MTRSILVFGFEGTSKKNKKICTEKYKFFLYIRLVGQAVKTSPSHGENRGSIPLRAVGIKTAQPKQVA